MSMTQTRTATTTVTDTYSQVLHVTRKVQADLLAILDLYEYFSDEYASNVINDIRLLLDEEVLSAIKFVWREKGTTKVIDEIVYTVVSGAKGLADEASGNIGYRAALASAHFHPRLSYNQRWKKMTDAQRVAIQKPLALKWGTGVPLDYSGGSHTSQQTYAKGNLALTRSRFVPK